MDYESMLDESIDHHLIRGLTNQERQQLLVEYGNRRKSATIGFLLAFLLGGFGAHRMYMGQFKSAVWYLLFFWTVIPSIVAFVEMFFMPSRVRRYNRMLQSAIVENMRRAATAGMGPAIEPASVGPAAEDVEVGNGGADVSVALPDGG